MVELSFKYSFRNNSSETLILIVEPWAEEFSVPNGSTVSISILYTDIGPLETEIIPGYLIVWAWQGCRAKVFLDGAEQMRPSLFIPVPT